MGPPSIRVRLTAWYGAILAATCTALGTAVYLLMGHALLERIDALLEFEYEETVERIKGGEAPESLSTEPTAFHQTYLLCVRDDRGRIWAASRALQGVALPPVTRAEAGSRADARPLLQTERIGRLGLHRIISGTVRRGDQALIVQVSRSLDDYDRELGELRAALLTILPAGLLAATAGGYWLAGRALAPVHRMTETARRISARHLDERIAAPNPRDELGRLAETLNSMIDRLGRALEAMRRFTADASHELRTPLTAIRAEAEVALQSARSPQYLAEVLRSIVEEVDRLTRLVNRLLLLSREDAAGVSGVRTPVRLDETIRKAAGLARTLAARAGVELLLEDVPEATVAGDPERLRQVFDNLLDNAIKYNRPGGSVVVRGRLDGPHVVVEVADTGPGIPPEAQPRIFDRFFRVDPARSRRIEGEGLGLSIAKALVEGHRGRIEVESRAGRGSTFRVWLPCVRNL